MRPDEDEEEEEAEVDEDEEEKDPGVGDGDESVMGRPALLSANAFARFAKATACMSAPAASRACSIEAINSGVVDDPLEVSNQIK